MSDFFKFLNKVADGTKRAAVVARQVEDVAERVSNGASSAKERLETNRCPACGEPAVEGLVGCPKHLSAAARLLKRLAGE